MLAVKSRVPQREGCMAVKSAAEQHHSFYLEVHAQPAWVGSHKHIDTSRNYVLPRGASWLSDNSLDLKDVR